MTLLLYALVVGFMAGLGTYRFSIVITLEHGPFSVFFRLRERFPNFVLLCCPMCMGGWIALLFAIWLAYIFPAPFGDFMPTCVLFWGYIWAVQDLVLQFMPKDVDQ